MSGDYSRFVFDPSRDYDGVLLQQGRPLTDWDWNDQVSLTGRRRQAAAADSFGGAVVPSTTPHGFEITVTGGKLSIGPGRIYVDGLVVENHGQPPLAWDPVLAELRGTAPTPYAASAAGEAQQPYLPDP